MDALEEEMARPPEERDPATVFPIILPRECARDDWPGPIVPLGTLPFAVAWAMVPTQNRFIYLTDELAAYWQSLGIAWQEEAMRNLARISQGRWWGDKCDEAGKPFVLALLTQDAMGPSRLLLPALFEDVLGLDYRVAIPERTCAIAYRADLSASQRADVDAMIEGCFEHGTEPMTNERFRAADFWVAPGWPPSATEV
ncbi:MAG: hypothetical protein M3177_04700 [Pseudomonadota bacterium]|nr:hypothetical protein [Pseudomonadota bacterium]